MTTFVTLWDTTGLRSHVYKVWHGDTVTVLWSCWEAIFGAMKRNFIYPKSDSLGQCLKKWGMWLAKIDWCCEENCVKKWWDRIVSTNKVNRDWWRQQTTFSQKMIWLYLFLCSVNELSLVTPAYKSGVLFIGIFWPPSKRRAQGKNSKNYPWGKVPIINLLGSQEILRLAK